MRASLLLWIAATGGLAAGLKAYREGRFADAQAAFRAAVDAGGDAVPGELLCNLSLAALRAGDLDVAEQSARRARQGAQAGAAAFATFLEGNVAFARCERAAELASQAESEPFAFDLAIRRAREAAGAWGAALLVRPEWEAARRNVERALLEIEKLQRQKAEREASEERKREAAPEEPPESAPPPEEAPRNPEERTLLASTEELAPEEVDRLFRRLESEEEEKRALRREQRARATLQVERDW